MVRMPEAPNSAQRFEFSTWLDLLSGTEGSPGQLPILGVTPKERSGLLLVSEALDLGPICLGGKGNCSAPGKGI